MDTYKKLLPEYLADIQKDGIGLFIDGQRTSSAEGATFTNKSPVDGKDICTVAAASVADVDRAVQSSLSAFETWRNTSHQDKKAILHAIAQKIEDHAEEIAVLESYDTGQPIRFMKKAAIRGAANFRYFADKVIDAPNGLSTPDTHHLNFTIRQPIGPVGVITPWNTPFMLSTWKIAPALAAGCTVIHKPAELSPVTASRLVELAHDAGLPKGVWNTVHGFGETTGKSLTEHEGVKAIAFVGETSTGSAIMRQGAATLKRVHFELGGKNPVIVFNDANLDRALDAVVFMKYSLNGERCTSSSRLLLHRDIYESFTAKLTKRVENLRVGHPLDPNTEIGPLIDAGHLSKVRSYVQIGRDEDGASLLTRNKLPEDLENGCYIKPVLFGDVNRNMRIANEEIFGPFLTVIPFTGEKEALEIANGVKYGLTAYLWTRDIERAHRMARDIEAGMIWVNSQNVRHLPAPFGGMKYSGIGRDGGDYSFDFYMETKNISIAYGTHNLPSLGS